MSYFKTTKITDGTDEALVTAAGELSVLDSQILSFLQAGVNAIPFNVKVKGSLPTGTNSIGQVTANAGTNLNTSLLATSAKQLADGHNVTANAGTNLNTSALATSAKQLPDGHGVVASQSVAASLNMTEASASAIKDAVEKMDDWDESDRAKVNPIAGQAGIAGGTGVDGATVPRVTLATDVGLPAGANSLGGIKWTDTTGTVNGFKNVDGNPRVVNQTYLEQIAEGNVTGHTPWSKIGFNPDIGTSEEDLWSNGGSYSFPATAIQMEILGSENTEDIGDIIFGSRTVPITSDAGGSTTTLLDADVDFTGGTAAAGDLLILDPSGTTPEWGWITTVDTHTLTFSGGLSSGGSGTSRKYLVVDASTHKGSLAVKIDYLDSTYAAKSMIIPTNGTTVVTTLDDAGAAQTILRINSFRHIAIGTEAGTTNLPYGYWIIRTAGGGTTYSYISLNKTRARNQQYTVPLGKTLYVNMWTVGWGYQSATSKNEYCRFYTRANVEPSTLFNTGVIFYPYTEVNLSNGTTSVQFPIPTRLPAKTDIRVTAVASSTGGAGTSVLRGWLETA